MAIRIVAIAIIAAAMGTTTVIALTTHLLDRFAVVEPGRRIVRRLSLREIDADFALVQFEAVGLVTGDFGVLLAFKVDETESF